MKCSPGQVIDLVSNDIQRLEEAVVKWFFYVVLAFINIVVGASLLVYFIGWQSLMGVILLCFLLPHFAGLSYDGATLRLRTAVVSDRRISHSRPQSCDPFGQRHGSRALARSENRKSANHGLPAFCAASEI